MTLKIDDSVKQQAIKLRAEGHSYASILNALSQYGATESWVKRVTKGVKKAPTRIQQAVEQVYRLASRPQGINQTEANNIYFRLFGTVKDEKTGAWTIDLTKSAKSQIRKQVREKATEEGTMVIFVPDWMDRQRPKESALLMNEIAQQLHEAIQSCVDDYIREFPRASRYAVEQELLTLAVPGYGFRSVEAHCRRTWDVVDQLVQAKQKLAQNEAQDVTEVLTNVEGSSAS